MLLPRYLYTAVVCFFVSLFVFSFGEGRANTAQLSALFVVVFVERLSTLVTPREKLGREKKLQQVGVR